MKKLLLAGLSSAFISSNAFAFVPNFDSPMTKNLSKKKVELETLSLRNLSFSKSRNNFLVEMEREALSLSKDGVVRVNQKHNGVEIYGAQIAFELRNGKVISRSGRVVDTFIDSVEPSISKQMALQVALRNKMSKYSSKLIIYPVKGNHKLVWHLLEDSFASKLNLFIDAQTGDILDSFNALALGHGHGQDGVEVNVDSTFDSTKNTYVLKTDNRVTYDIKNGGMIWGNFILGLPGKLAESTNDIWTDAAVVDAHNFAGEFLNVLKNKFNRNSFDGKGAKVISTVHFMEDFVNAFWNGKQMVYGDGDGKFATALSGALDVVAHEISHAITTSTSGLVYKDESGALNESFSDIMAVYAEYIIQPQKFDWLMGEDIWTPSVEGDALRYMDNPNRDKNPNPKPGSEWAYSRDHYADLYSGKEDNGGVHINSGISNLAFYLLAEGGKHPTRSSATLAGIGIEKAVQIVYRAYTNKLVKTSNFSDARAAMIDVARADFDTQTVAAVKAAWDAVGVQ